MQTVQLGGGQSRFIADLISATSLSSPAASKDAHLHPWCGLGHVSAQPAHGCEHRGQEHGGVGLTAPKMGRRRKAKLCKDMHAHHEADQRRCLPITILRTPLPVPQSQATPREDPNGNVLGPFRERWSLNSAFLYHPQGHLHHLCLPSPGAVLSPGQILGAY